MQRLCHARGMRLAVQPYITTGQDLDAANYTDEPTGEFWSHPFQPNDYRTTVKAAVSAANLNGRLIVGAEAFTASETERWLAHPATLKALGDQVFCLGANRFQFHRFAMQRFPQVQPGMTMGKWGQHYDSTQTWWEWSKPWHDYLARCQYMLRQGPVVTDVLQVAPEEPLFRFEHKPVPGYDYDACGPENFQRLVMTDGKPGLPGRPGYPLVTVAHHGTMSLGRLEKIRALLEAGANVLCDPPSATPGLENFPRADRALRDLAAVLWGPDTSNDRRIGKGRLFRGISPREALDRLQIPAAFTGPDGLSWIHRRAGDTDIFFVASSADTPTVSSCSFRVSGKSAELWQPESGEIQSIGLQPAAGGRGSASISLPPLGSAFLVFRPGPATTPPPAPMPADAGQAAGIRELPGPWQLAFPSGSGAPRAITLPKLVSWSQHEDKNIRHFSGTAEYRTQFEMPESNSRVHLDLGKVQVMARVHLNDQDLGILWKAPFRVDLTRALRTGSNDLRIEVVNLWPNRLIGDAALPEDSDRDAKGTLKAWPQWLLDGQPSPTGRRTFVTFPLWKPEEALLESGLLGPVTLVPSARPR
jgi:hypothetical protein